MNPRQLSNQPSPSPTSARGSSQAGAMPLSTGNNGGSGAATIAAMTAAASRGGAVAPAHARAPAAAASAPTGGILSQPQQHPGLIGMPPPQRTTSQHPGVATAGSGMPLRPQGMPSARAHGAAGSAAQMPTTAGQLPGVGATPAGVVRPGTGTQPGTVYTTAVGQPPTAGNAAAVAQAQAQQQQQQQQRLSAQQYLMQTQLMEYIEAVCSQERAIHRRTYRLEKVPGFFQAVQFAIGKIIGDVFMHAVDVSQIRIDTGVHELLIDCIEEDLSTLVRMEELKALDEQQQKDASAAQGPPPSEAAPTSESNSQVSARPGRRKRRAEEPPPAPAPASKVGDASGTEKASLFQKASLPTAASIAEQTREATLVQRRQAELSREVTIEDILAVLQLDHDTDPVVALPTRFKKEFLDLWERYFQPVLLFRRQP